MSPIQRGGGGGGTGDGFTNVVKPSDQSVASNTTPANDNALLFPAVAGEYEIELCLIYGSPAGGGTPDIKLQWGNSAGALLGPWFVFGISTTETGVSSVLATPSSPGALGTAVADRVLWVKGLFNSSGPMTIALQWSQNTSGVNPTIVRAGSTLRYRLIPPSGGGGGGGGPVSALLHVSGSLTSAQILSLNTSPIQLAPAPGPGLAYVPYMGALSIRKGTTAYAAGGNLVAGPAGFPGDALLNFIGSQDSLQDLTGSANYLGCATSASFDPTSEFNNQALVLMCRTANFTTGDGTLTYSVFYELVTLA